EVGERDGGAAEDQRILGAVGRPYAGGAVVGVGEDPAAVGAEGDLADLALVPGELTQRGAVVRGPEGGVAIGRAGDERAAVDGPVEGQDAPGVTAQHE